MKPTREEMAQFERWLDFYSDKFSRISDDGLRGYWWLYGRASEETAPVREMACWSAVNAAMQQRGL